MAARWRLPNAVAAAAAAAAVGTLLALLMLAADAATAAATTAYTVRYVDTPERNGTSYVVKRLAPAEQLWDNPPIAATSSGTTTFSLLSADPKIAWYSKPAKVSNRASLPAPFAALFSDTTEYPAVDRLGPALYVAYDPADAPYVVYFGGAGDEAFVCLRAPRFSTGLVACGNATTTDLRATELAPAALWMAVASVDASADVVQATVVANETAPDAAVFGGALTLAASRLGAQYNHVTEMAAVRDTNVERRASSYDVVVALLFLLALAMFWHVLLAAALLSWTVSLDRFGWSPRTAFFVWSAVLYVVCLAVSLPTGFLGWAVVGVFYALVELVVGGVAVYVACKRRRRSGGKGSGGGRGREEGSSSDSTPEPTPLQEAMEMRETGSNGTFGHESTDFSSTTHMTGRKASDEAAADDDEERDTWSVLPDRMGRMQLWLSIGSAVWVVAGRRQAALVILLIVGAAWSVDEYYVYDRQTGSYVAEIQPVTVSKSTLALYSVDGMATALQMNIFLETFTNICGGLYRTPLTTEEAKKAAIYDDYVDLYGINMTEFDPSDWRAYDTVNDFFIRNLRAGARPIAYPNDDNYVVSPADARLYGFQHVPADWSFIIKEESFTLASLLGDDGLAANFADGSMFSVRLAPQDYHHFHAPVAGTVSLIKDIAGTIYSVNADAVMSQNYVYENKRRVVIIDSPSLGKVGFVAIGATCVGSIVTDLAVGQAVAKGEKIGRFEFGGSTILLLFQPNAVTVSPDIVQSTRALVETLVRMGTEIAFA